MYTHPNPPPNTPVYEAIARIAVRARNFLVLLALSFSASPPASATEDGFSPLFTGTLNGDFVTAGRYSRVFGAPTAQSDPFMLTLSGIPAGSTVVKAFANWTYLTDLPGDPGEASITINGSPVVGILAMGAPDVGWGKSSSASYTADVTSLVSGNGVFSIGSAIDDVVSGAYGEGFSLVTVFSNPALPLSNVYVYSGLASNTSNPPEGFAPAVAKYDFTLGPYTGGPAHFFINAFDGQMGADEFSINDLNAGGILGGTGSALDAWQGKLGPALSGNLYDHGEGNAAGFMAVGQTSLTARTAIGAGAAGDAVGHSIGAIQFSVPEPGAALLGAGTLAALLLARRRQPTKANRVTVKPTANQDKGN